MPTATSDKPHVVSKAEWLAARKQFLQKEREFTHLRDELSRLRRELPWEKVQKPYMFQGANGSETFADLFGGRGQLLVYHFMFGPGWKEGCPSCSYIGDSFDAITHHLAQRDTAFTAISHATYPEIAAFKKRMGWRFHWVSSFGTEFNHDFGVSFSKDENERKQQVYNFGSLGFPSEEAPGASAFIRKGSDIFHTYSTYARGLDILIPTYNWLDLTAKGRDEDSLPHPMAWVRHHDRYSENKIVGISNLAK